MMSPFSESKEQLMSESKITKGDLKIIWFTRALPFRLNDQLISMHMQGENCKVRLMNMAETYTVNHHRNKAYHNYQEFPVGLTKLHGNKLFGVFS